MEEMKWRERLGGGEKQCIVENKGSGVTFCLDVQRARE